MGRTSRPPGRLFLFDEYVRTGFARYCFAIRRTPRPLARAVRAEVRPPQTEIVFMVHPKVQYPFPAPATWTIGLKLGSPQDEFTLAGRSLARWRLEARAIRLARGRSAAHLHTGRRTATTMLILPTRVYDHYVDATDVVQELRKAAGARHQSDHPGRSGHRSSEGCRDRRGTGRARRAVNGAGAGDDPRYRTRRHDRMACRGRSGGRPSRRRPWGSVPGRPEWRRGTRDRRVSPPWRHVGDGPGAGGRQKLRGHHDPRGGQPAGPRRRLPRNGMDVV
jgi:hypothetical protein